MSERAVLQFVRLVIERIIAAGCAGISPAIDPVVIGGSACGASGGGCQR